MRLCRASFRSSLPLRLTFLLLLTFLSTAAFADTWREIQSPHFRVVTDGSEHEGQAVAKEFEQMRYIFTLRFDHITLENGAPLLILAVHDSSLAQIAPVFAKERDRVAGQFFLGWERQFAFIRLDTFGDLNQAVVFQEYTYSILHANFHWLPTWFDTGTAEFYGYTRFDKEQTYVGAPSTRLRFLQKAFLIPTADMLVATQRTYFKDQHQDEIFRAEAWAMIHYMTFDKQMEHGAKLNRFVKLLEDGTPQLEAFQQVFGDPKRFDTGLYGYIHSIENTAGGYPPAPNLDAKTFTSTTLTLAQINYALGSLDIAAHDHTTARTHLEAAIAADPTLAPAHEELAFLDFDQGRDQDAHTEWSKALSLDPNLYRSAFALLMTGPALSTQSPDQLRETQKALQHLTQIAPLYAPPFVELALTDWRLNQLQDAYKTSRTAEHLAPWRAGYHLLTGYILLNGKQPAIAASFARNVAERWPGSDHNQAVDLWNLVPAAAREGVPLTPIYPHADLKPAIAQGKLLSAVCEKTAERNHLRITFQPDRSTTPLTLINDGGFESGFADTLWFGRDHYTTCFHLAGLPATVIYAPSPTGNNLLGLEVKDDLPTPLPPPPTQAAASSNP